MNDQNVQHACIACNSKRITSHNEFQSKMLVICQECGLIFDKRIPTNKELFDHYAIYSYTQRKPVSPATQASFNDLLDRFEPFRKKNKILDIGCGQGDFLLAAKDRGWDVYGNEYSSSAVKLCTDKDICMQQGDFDVSFFGEEQFDIVTSFEVLEHTNKPHELINSVTTSLRIGGLFYLTTPNFNSSLKYIEGDGFSIICYPEHISFYTKKSIQVLLDQYPLKKIKIITTGINIYKFKNYIKELIGNTKSTVPISSLEARQADVSIRNHASRGFGKFIKNSVNLVLNLFSIGDTLKIFYIKS